MITSREIAYRFTDLLKVAFKDQKNRELLQWCFPALLLGFALRLLLTYQLPYGYFHFDTPDFLITPERLLFEHRFEIHTKKTFLPPIFFALPFLIRIPALLLIPAVQHVLGTALILIVGALCRIWFFRWKILIVPLTMVVAIDPNLLWYEHTLLAESLFVFCTALLALAGTLYTNSQSKRRFVFLCTALVLEAGARPEGKLFLGFGILLVGLVHFGSWRQHVTRFGLLIALVIAVHFLTRTSQAGLLLYTSVARFTPHQLSSAAGFYPYIKDERDTLKKQWQQHRAFPRVIDRRIVADAVERYLNDTQKSPLSRRHVNVNDLCFKLARETCLRNFVAMPSHAFDKFQFSAKVTPAGRFDKEWLLDFQKKVYTHQIGRTIRLSRGLTGTLLGSEAEIFRFIDTHYPEVPWFNQLQDRWQGALNYFCFRGTRLPGLPFYFAAAALGLAVTMCHAPTVPRFHLAWGIALAGSFYIIMLTANVKPRFRIVFEPFWFIYCALLLEAMINVLQRFAGLREVGNKIANASPAEEARS